MIGYLPCVGVQLFLEGLIPNCPNCKLNMIPISHLAPLRMIWFQENGRWYFFRSSDSQERIFCPNNYFSEFRSEIFGIVFCNFLLLVIVVVSELWFLCSFSWPQSFYHITDIEFARKSLFQRNPWTSIFPFSNCLQLV